MAEVKKGGKNADRFIGRLLNLWSKYNLKGSDSDAKVIGWISNESFFCVGNVGFDPAGLGVR